MRAIRIAVPSYVFFDPNYGGSPGYPRMVLNEDFPRSIQDAGAACYILAASEDTSFLEEQISYMDGIILPGGDDIDPIYYGEEPKNSKLYNPLRDTFESELLRIAVEQEKPVLGICRGMQFINVFFGGTLFQDVKGDGATTYEHIQAANFHCPFHHVDVEEKSFLHEATGKRELRVNSLHHQAVKDIAPGFEVTARSRDRLVEAIERREGSFVAGVQWHPEMMSTHDSDARAIFRHFIEVVRTSREKSV